MSQDNRQLAGGVTPEPPVEMLPSHIAVTKNDVDKLSELVANGETLVDPNSKETVLHAAVRAGAKEAVKYILREKLVSPTALSATGHTAAHYAALYGQPDTLKVVLTFDSGLSDQLAHQLDETGLSLLSLATLGGNKDMASWLLERYPDLANSANSNGNLAVHFAAAQGQLEILKLLINKCGREMAEKQDSRQTKPVYFAAQEGRLKVLDYLINELEVDGVARDKAGMCSVHAATQGGHPTTVKWLVNKLGTNYILDKTVDGGTPLHMAASQGSLEVLRFFLDKLENEADVNVQDNINATPAHDAAEFGQTQAMILLLKAGADLTIQDCENKTPHQLAVEQEHQELANMINDYRKGGLAAISKYEKKKKRSHEDRSRGNTRTSRQEAVELSTVIQATAEVVDKRKEQNLQRQNSLNKMNEVGLDEGSRTPGSHGNGSRKPRGGFSDEDKDIEHHLGPLGGVYARPNKKASRSKTGSKQNSDIEDFIEETMSHRSYSSNKHRATGPYHLPGGDDGPYATINYETASNVSRPSRVKRYHDSESDVSSFAGSAGHFYHSGRYPMPYGQFPPPLPPPRGSRGPRSVASSKASSLRGSQYSGHRMPYGGVPYGYPPAPGPNMMHPYYPGYYAGGYPPQAYGMPMYGPPPGLYLQRHRLHHQQKAGRKASLLKGKKKKAPNYDASAEQSGTQTPRKHTDQDMGYGPSVSAPSKSAADTALHPPAPPITKKDGTMETNEVVTHDSNFIMAKRTEDTQSRRIGETTLNPTQTQRAYDGRYDKYIMTDSESETELPEHVGVACAAEAAAIVAIGCVAGLRGLAKMKKGDKPSKVADSRQADKQSLSSAWDNTHEGVGRKGKHGGSSTALDDPLLQGMSPEEFASHEEWDRTDWDGASDKKKKKKKKKDKDKPSGEVKGQTDPNEPLSELMTPDLHKLASASVSKSFGEQILSSALGARHSSMLNIASSAAGSRMSLNISSGEEQEDDDDFNAAISMVTGTPLKDKDKPKQSTKKAAAMDLSTIGKEEKVAKEDKKTKKKKEKDAASEAKKQEKKERKEQKAREKEQRQKEKSLAKEKKKEKKSKEVKEPPVVEATPTKPPPEPKKTQPAPVKSKETKQTKSRTSAADNKPQRKAPAPPASKKQGRPTSGGPREVENKVTMFDTESDSDDSEVKGKKTKTSGGFDPTQGTGKAAVAQSSDSIMIEADEQTLDIFGEDGLAELNEALMELSNIQSSFPDPTAEAPPTNKVSKVTQQRESQRSTMEKGEKVTKSTQVKVKKSSKESRSAAGGSVTTATETPQRSTTSTAVQGEHYSSSFEENVLNILRGLTDTMHQMRANPSVTQTEIHQQELLQQQMIQSLITYSENNPDLTAKLLSMLKREQNPYNESTTTKNAYDLLEQKLLQAQELQSRHATDYLRTQEEFQQSIHRRLEEQAEQQLKLIQSNFEKYSQLLNEKEGKKKKKKKKKGKKYSDGGSTASSDSDDGFVQPVKQTSLTKPAVKTMHAKIYHQDLLDEDTMRSSSQSSLTGKLREKKISLDRLRRQDTSLSFDRTQDALRRFESVSAPLEEDEDDDEMQSPQQVRPVTLKKADIMKIREQAQREEQTARKVTVSQTVQKAEKAEMKRIGSAKRTAHLEDKPMEKFDIKYGHHVETNEHKKNLAPKDSTIAGAGGELATVLKVRQKRIGVKD